MTSPALARDLWHRYESVHIVTYFHPAAREAFEAVGLKGFWRGYFGGRAAPFGATGPAPVVASFFSFAPVMVERALPDIWTRADPQTALRARIDGAVAALTDIYSGDGDHTRDHVELAALLERVVDAADYTGRVLAAANRGLETPDEPLARVWHATTVLREHRGDGHNAALVAAGLDGCEVLTLRAGLDLTRDALQPARGWTDDEWSDAAQRLVDRGLLDADGRATTAGAALYAGVEATTDVLAAAPWSALAPAEIRRVGVLLEPFAEGVRSVLPSVNPIGVRPRTDPVEV
jgi:helix-turn-helix protein